MLTNMRRRLIRMSESRVFGAAVSGLQMLPDRNANLLRVLMFHRVAEEDERRDLDPTLISATPPQFARHIDWLSREFEFVSLRDVLLAVNGEESLPPRALLLTVDDAYLDFVQHAWPILSSKSVPAVLCVPTAFPDHPTRAFWWDRLHCALILTDQPGQIETCFGAQSLETPARRSDVFRELKRKLKQLPDQELQKQVDRICAQRDAPHPGPAVMSWKQLRDVSQAGVTLIPHTHTHPLLNRISPDDAYAEIRESRNELIRQIGESPPAFAYPAGYYSSQVAEILHAEGFQVAFSTIRGINDLRSIDPLRIRRTNVGRHTPDALIRAQLIASARILNPAVPTIFPSCKVNSDSYHNFMTGQHSVREPDCDAVDKNACHTF